MLQTKFSVFYRNLCGHVKFGDNIFGSKINWNEYQTKFNLCQLESSKTYTFDKIIWEDVTSGLIMRRLPVRCFFRKFTTIQNHLQERRVAHVRRCCSALFRDRAFCLRSRVLGLWQCYIWKSGWIGDEMKGMVMKQAPGSKKSTFEVYEAGKVESKGTSPECSKPRIKCPFKKSRTEEMPCEAAEVMTVQCASTTDGENCDEIDECGKACSPSGDGKKKKSWLSNVRSSKSSSRSGCCTPAKSNSRNRSCGKCPPLPSGPVACRKPCTPCVCPPCPCPPCPCPPPCPPPKSRCCPPPSCCPPPCCPPPCCPPPCCPPPCCPPPCPPPPPPPCCPPPCCPPPCCPPPCCPPPCCPKMEALQFDAACRALNFYMLNAPTSIRKDEVLVQVVYSGVSCTDLMIMEGRFPIKCQPVILGHEISGIACAVGSGVCHVKCGDCIAVNPYGACQVCRYCTRGQFGSCICEGLCNSIGINKDGGWAEFVVVNKTQVHPIPSCLTLAQAVLVQPLSCIVNAMSKLDLQFGADIVIQGLGISGCLWASLLHLKGFRNVIASDMSEYKRKLLECLDLKYCVYPPEKMCDVKADIVIDCTGCARSIEQSINMLNPNGQLCIFGMAPPEEEMSIQPYELTRKEATVFSVVTNTNSFTRAIAAAEAMGCRYLDYERLGMQLFKLGQYEGAFQMKRCGEINKIVFKIDNCK